MRSMAANSRSTTGLFLRRHAFLAGLITVYGALAYWLSLSHEVVIGDEKVATLVRSYVIKVPQMVFFILFFRLIQLTYFDRVADRFGVLKREVASFVSDRERMIGSLLTVLLMSLMLVSFAQIKNLIPTLNPFSWDVAFMQIDKALHFGVLPHEPLLALFGFDLGLTLFTGIYNAWLFLMYFSLLIACFMRSASATRMQFLIAFVLTWAIGGNLVAGVFSSAGPVYYSHLGLGDAYDGLLAHLHDHAAAGGLSVVETQSLLWQFYALQPSVNAISAFPSMHVASSVLMALFAFRHSRWMGRTATVFAGAVMIGSVLLAWHYAVDGYAGAAIAILCWKVAGWLVRRDGLFAAPAL